MEKPIDGASLMYLKRLEIENTGPINFVRYSFPFGDAGQPKPVVFVGSNGAGKSILIAHIVSAILAGQSEFFEDSEVEKGKVYKLRASSYIRFGQNYSRSVTEFTNGYEVSEIQMNQLKSDFENNVGFVPADYRWAEMSDDEFSLYRSNINQVGSSVKESISRNTFLYFPPNRFEEPAWLNEHNLKKHASYTKISGLSSRSDRPIVNERPLRENQDWLLDIIFDSQALEITAIQVVGVTGTQAHAHRAGPATDILKNISKFMQTIFRRTGAVQYSVGARGGREVSVSIGKELATSNLFSSSTGQSAVLNLFLTILRDHDLAKTVPVRLDQIKGIVVIDEIDAHLHTNQQFKALPELISMFPSIQFVLTSHSPLFMLGLETRLGENGVEIIELPVGMRITTERFIEFRDAYERLKETKRFDDDIAQAIKASHKPKIFVEGAIDVDYVKHAAVLLGKQSIIDEIDLHDGGGSGGLDNIFKRYDNALGDTLAVKVVLIYDCDVKKPEKKRCQIVTKHLPELRNPIKRGIEKLFPSQAIERVLLANERSIDTTSAHNRTERGIKINVSEEKTINTNENRNMCNWLIENGTRDDFSNFEILFDLIEEAIN